MKLLGLTIERSRSKAMQPVDSSRGWLRLIQESYPGAWQHNVTVEVANVLSHPTMYACISLIATEIAKMRLLLVELTADGIWQEASIPAFSPVLAKPNHYQTRIEFVTQWVLSRLTHGNTYVLKERDNRRVVTAMYVLDPRRVRVQVADNGDVWYEIWQESGWNQLTGLDDQTVSVPASEVMHDKMPALFHPLVGVSPIYANGVAAVQGLRMQASSASFFGNGARPAGVLTAPERISDETAARLKEYFDTNFTGQHAGKTAVLGDNLKYTPMTMSSVDAQLIEQLKWTDEKICSCYHVPPDMVGVGPPQLAGNVEMRWQQFYAQCLQIHIRSIQLALNEGLGLGKVGSHTYGVHFDLDDLLLMDQTSKIKSLREGLAGIYSPNEARKKMGLPPTDGGEDVYMQHQYYSLAALAERDAAGPPTAPLALPAPSEGAEPDEEEPAPEDEEVTEEEVDKFVAALRRKGDIRDAA